MPLANFATAVAHRRRQTLNSCFVIYREKVNALKNLIDTGSQYGMFDVACEPDLNDLKLI